MTHEPDNQYPVDPTDYPNPDVPLPAGATTDGWLSLNPEDNLPVRSLLWWTRRALDGVHVDVAGWQESNGNFTRAIEMYGTEQVELKADDARALAQALIDAATELDRLDSGQ